MSVDIKLLQLDLPYLFFAQAGLELFGFNQL
ncbi:hypothetical protein NTG1052_990015 [Candidatus Nitrotoga sp. 1052]|nr:hypothetical protein NTG1052_990015 [Candidatus Nitrotoga sp. 1052]